MRRVLSIALLFAGSLTAQTASLAGVVVDQTGAPMAGIHVRFLTAEFGSDEGAQAVYGVTSDSAGKFSVESLKPGLYMVMAERAGYVQAVSDNPMGFAMTAVKAGQHVADYQVVLTARALIVGHVVDEFGDPVQGVNVRAEGVKGQHGEGVFFGAQNSATDDRGEFRIVTAPGKYYVKAEFDSMDGIQGEPETRTDGTSAAPFDTTYYPSAANTGAASVIQVAAGQDLAGLEIRLLRMAPSSTRTFSVSGSVLGLPDNQPAVVNLRFGEKPDEMTGSNGAGTSPDGKFSIGGLQPGYYSASATYTGGKTPLQSRAVRFHLDSSDETGLQLTLAPGEDLNGKLEILGDVPGDAPADKEKRVVRLESEAWGDRFQDGGLPPAEVQPDGSFHFHDVPPALLKPVVEPMPENRYLKEVALDGKPVTEGILDFSQGVGGARLKLTISRDAAQIAGRVLDKDGDPVLGLTIVYFTNDVKHVEESSQTRVTDGKYSFKAVRPGKYRIFALDVAEMMKAFSGDGDNENVLQQFFDAAEEIEVKEGDRITKDLSAIVKQPDRKEKQ